MLQILTKFVYYPCYYLGYFWDKYPKKWAIIPHYPTIVIFAKKVLNMFEQPYY